MRSVTPSLASASSASSARTPPLALPLAAGALALADGTALVGPGENGGGMSAGRAAGTPAIVGGVDGGTAGTNNGVRFRPGEPGGDGGGTAGTA